MFKNIIYSSIKTKYLEFFKIKVGFIYSEMHLSVQFDEFWQMHTPAYVTPQLLSPVKIQNIFLTAESSLLPLPVNLCSTSNSRQPRFWLLSP